MKVGWLERQSCGDPLFVDVEPHGTQDERYGALVIGVDDEAQRTSADVLGEIHHL
ncbi:hypothetical protein HQ346_19105 [Rhodococcus sp. BP-252]|uniref:hypothetical protein n=1 Tax=unclassified Rhodococcus (in: high G+C Gram-positive bacteria) TaxID=192944 RepID=UPI001C9B65BA|nr:MULTISPECIES: hypothetical protein [unclassified Rhodococcus (in: high G+C Gram-positive bacteria)]MBY6413808.1 hypothetical protein [Rhodococcus sp. BP-320]MBY6418411.1 hypothetical protein [Rhodococcus sp. BP-321]MBY6422536.1 hypothetical protein [Rhodococcus sp. BP-324]MBY6428447.1 hypothetical protein [Rhodococcus sp. BP-323]MBY6433624.1 hypothetical protein [Rhodococcus sp. BP-322]